ncbi:MAG: hypothetical protein K9H25_06000 [Rhodospirillum sp.]|nr:hypothetical protein [Rhodospirillum sp.]MCF8491399.1 hypothetical protein [Rhodospirillum sp.]MCF8501461.1 hypothetical protein [Rhodospirillum sp.]
MTAIKPSSHITEIKSALARADVSGTLPELPKSITDWLAQLVLLDGVPLSYLVPEPDLLPTESLRFFYLDSNWLRRLIDGALSIGLSSSLDVGVLLATYEDTVLESLSKLSSVRAARRGLTATIEATDETPTTITGFLLRSRVVSGWPGMEVAAYADPNGRPLTLLRLDRVNSDIMLGLFMGVPSEVRFLEPPEGLHFGVIPQAGEPIVYLRGLGYGDDPAGIQILPAVAGPLVERDAATGVLNISGSVDSLKAALKTAGAWSEGDPFTSAEFAIQMTRGAGLQIFQWSS